jgi:hypothetical protein
MRVNRTALLTECRLASWFNDVRQRLLELAPPARLDKPLAYWVLPGDRRLPLIFMGRTLKDLLSTPFEELMATPGVGQKKMIAMVGLLERALARLDEATTTVPIEQGRVAGNGAAESVPRDAPFDSGAVSEMSWAAWCENVRRYHLEEETLGRFSPSLERLPRVLWHTPLNAYCHLSLQQIRALKTHGQKRVAAIIEVFHELHNVLAGLGATGTLAVRVQPRLAGQMENWIIAALERPEPPSPDEVNRQLIVPLLEQVRTDLGESVAGLLQDRLGMGSTEASVRQTAHNLGLSRARIYQLLADAAEVILVRWPEGQYLVNHLAERILSRVEEPRAYEPLRIVAELLFPDRHAQPPARQQEAKLAVGVLDHRRAG